MICIRCSSLLLACDCKCTAVCIGSRSKENKAKRNALQYETFEGCYLPLNRANTPTTNLCYALLYSCGVCTPRGKYTVDDRYLGYLLSSELKTSTLMKKRDIPDFVANDSGWVPLPVPMHRFAMNKIL